MKVTLIDKLKAKALITAPFFASLLLRRPLLEDRSCPTAWTDGDQIGYNPDFFNRLTFREALCVLCHEILHIAFLHHLRIVDRDPEKWNEACDYAINLILVDSGFDLPKGALLNKAYAGMSAEQIYSLLPDNYRDCAVTYSGKQNPGKQNEEFVNGSSVKPLRIGEVKQKKFNSTKARDLCINDLKGQLTEAMQTAKMRGLMPGALDILVPLLDRATIDWKETLASFLTERIKSGTDFSKPNRRWIPSNLFLPSRSTIARGKFVLAVDVSGSISTNQLERYSAEILSILNMTSDTLLVLFFDTRITKVFELDEGHIENLQTVGGGGTDYAPVMEYLKQEEIDPEALIILTDGECNSFAGEPDYPVLWTVDGLEFSPPYGEVVILPQAA